jgi:3-hydroxybutyrate dehydrogenase
MFDPGLHGLINNAGIIRTSGPIEWKNKKAYEDVLEVNLYGTILVTTAFLPLIRKARGRVVNVSSVAAVLAGTGAVEYTISKFGVEAFSDVLRCV